MSNKCRLSRHFHLRYSAKEASEDLRICSGFGQDEHRACGNTFAIVPAFVESSEPNLLVLIVRGSLFQMRNASAICFTVIESRECPQQDS
jgi:hypothetical protein